MDNQPSERSVSRTAAQTRDSFGLGRTPGQRSAELVAGVRAEADPSPETQALSRMMGRVAARLVNAMAPKNFRHTLSVIVVRTHSMLDIAEKRLQGENLRVVKVAPGFGPVGLRLARSRPDVQVIEIDLPDVVKEKQKRLRQGGIDVPPNLEWREADLGVVTLREVIGDEPVDMVLAPGLLPYFTREEVQHITTGIRDVLKPGCYFLGDVAWKLDFDRRDETSALSWYNRQVAKLHTWLNSAEEAPELFPGYEDVEVIILSDEAQRLELDMQVADYTVLISARKPIATPETAPSAEATAEPTAAATPEDDPADSAADTPEPAGDSSSDD